MKLPHVKHYRLAPTAGGVKEFKGKVACVTVRNGALTGARIHWSAPSMQSFVGYDSEQLVDGETYLAPGDEPAEGFWITFPSTTALAPADLELTALDCVTPVVVLNARNRGSAKIHVVQQGTDALIEVADGLITAYRDEIPSAVGFESTQNTAYASRGFIGGSFVGTGPAAQNLQIVAWQRVKPDSNDYWAELARWELGVRDAGATKYSCVFEVGAQSTWRSTATYIRDGYRLIPWPAYGLMLTFQSTVGDFTDCAWSLYERSEQ